MQFVCVNRRHNVVVGLFNCTIEVLLLIAALAYVRVAIETNDMSEFLYDVYMQ